MAVIHEELVLADRFSATFNKYIEAAKSSGDYTKEVASASQMAKTEASLLASALNVEAAQAKAAEAGQRQLAAASKADAAASNAAAAAARAKAASLNEAAAAARLEAASSAAAAAESRAKAASYNEAAAAARAEAAQAKAASAAQDKMNSSMRQGASAASGLESRLLSLARAYVSLRGAQSFVELADTFTQTTARLERMNDGMQDTAELQNMIYQAAQRSRGAYQETADMVAKLGTLAPDAFSSNKELVAFAEQINKQFALAGASGQGAQAALLQLTQAMSSGVLRGEELNSVLEQAPTIAQAIARYMGVTVGEMRELASEGKITAQVVKNALFDAAKDTNAAFDKIPLTFGQAWTMAGNAAVKAMEPAMTRLNDLLNSDLGRSAVNGLIAAFELLGSAASGVVDLLAMGAQWVADNWDLVQAVLIGVGAAALVAGAHMAAAAIHSAVAWAAANWSLLLVAAGVALIIYMLRQMGATWEEIAGVVGGVLGVMYAAVMNTFVVPAQNAFARLANFVGNLFTNPLAAVKMLFLDMARTVLGYMSNVAHGIENLINKIPGMSVNLTSGIDNIYRMVQSASQNVKSASGWKEYVKAWDFVDYSGAWNSGYSKGSGIGRALDNFNVNDLLGGFSGGGANTGLPAAPDASGVPDTLKGIKGDTAAIKRSVSLSEEDVKLLVDMAERRYVNNINLTAQTPVITINGQNTGNTEEDLRWLENALQKILTEQAASHTDMSYK